MYDRYRDATWAQVSVGVDPDPTNNAQIIAWTRDYWEVLRKYSVNPCPPAGTKAFSSKCWYKGGHGKYPATSSPL
jgi:hypothetical protein